MLTDIATFTAIILILAGAAWKLLSDRKKGGACSGCPHARLGNQGCDCPDK